MPSPHKYVRNILHSLCGLHKAGYGKIRFMPLFANGKYSIKIGPKRVFAKRDGLFIPQDMRHRSLLITDANSVFDRDTVIGGTFVSEGRPLLSELRCLVLGGNHVDRSLDDGLCGSDPDYTKWLTSLSAFLDDFDFALPVRCDDEYMSQVPPLLRVEFLQQINSRPLAPTIRFELPPEGLLIVTPPHQQNNAGHGGRNSASEVPPPPEKRRKKNSYPCPVCRHELQDLPPLVCPNCNTGIPADAKEVSLRWPEHKNVSPDNSDGNDGRHIADC